MRLFQRAKGKCVGEPRHWIALAFLSLGEQSLRGISELNYHDGGHLVEQSCVIEEKYFEG